MEGDRDSSSKMMRMRIIFSGPGDVTYMEKILFIYFEIFAKYIQKRTGEIYGQKIFMQRKIHSS